MSRYSAIGRVARFLSAALALSATTALAADPPLNPALGAPTYAVTHFDSAQTDSFPYAVADGTRTISGTLLLPPAPQVPAGPISLMTLAAADPDYMWGVSTTGVSYISVANNHFAPVARRLFPGVTTATEDLLNGLLTDPIGTLADAQDIIGDLGIFGLSGGIPGAYSVVDTDNLLYVNYGSNVYAFRFVPGLLGLLPRVEIARTLDATTFLDPGESITGLVMTYDGKLVVIGTRSTSIVERSFAGTPKRVAFGTDESISNSAAVDEYNGIYVVSDKKMRKLVWTGSVLSESPADGAWISDYPTGDTFPTAFGSGSGATPTLMGFGNDPDKLVVITDGFQRMQLVAFWRDQIPAGHANRIAGIIQVNCGLPAGYQIQTDQSVAVNGYGAFVVNNVSAADGSTGSGSSPLVDNLVRGTLLPSPVGVERFEWNPVTDSWSSTWARSDISSNSMVPSISRPSSLVFTSGHYPGEGWVVTGLDWNTGQTRHRTLMGQGLLGNGFYALLQFMPDGDLLFNSILGPTRVQLPSGVVNPN